MIRILDQEHTILGKFIAELRDTDIQRDTMRFRRNLERVGEVMAYEISKTLTYRPTAVETPLGEAEVYLPTDKIVIATILRAGIPFHQGLLNYFDTAENGFVSAYRKYGKDGKFHINIEYVSACDLTGKTLILADPMLATGASIALAYKALTEKGGIPAHVHIASVVASEEGTDYARKHLPRGRTTIWTGAMDQELTVKSYIIPGIGDVGDLAYGEKL